MPVACLRNLQPTPKDHVSAIRRYRGTWLTLPVLRAGWRRVRSCPDEPLKQCWAQMLCFSVPCSSCLMSGWHRQNKSGLGQPDKSYAGWINETQFNQFTEAASSSSYKLHSVQILIFLQLSLDELLLCFFFFFFFIISVLFSFRSSSVGLANCCRQCWRKGNVEQPTADKNCRGTRPWSICLIYMPHEVVGKSASNRNTSPNFTVHLCLFFLFYPPGRGGIGFGGGSNNRSSDTAPLSLTRPMFHYFLPTREKCCTLRLIKIFLNIWLYRSV